MTSDSMNSQSSFTRREFVRSAAVAGSALAMSAKSYSQVTGANERVRIGLIGFGLIGRIHARSFMGLPESQIVAISDCYEPRRQAAKELIGGDVKLHADF